MIRIYNGEREREREIGEREREMWKLEFVLFIET